MKETVLYSISCRLLRQKWIITMSNMVRVHQNHQVLHVIALIRNVKIQVVVILEEGLKLQVLLLLLIRNANRTENVHMKFVKIKAMTKNIQTVFNHIVFKIPRSNNVGTLLMSRINVSTITNPNAPKKCATRTQTYALTQCVRNSNCIPTFHNALQLSVALMNKKDNAGTQRIQRNNASMEIKHFAH